MVTLTGADPVGLVAVVPMAVQVERTAGMGHKVVHHTMPQQAREQVFQRKSSGKRRVRYTLLAAMDLPQIPRSPEQPIRATVDTAAEPLPRTAHRAY